MPALVELIADQIAVTAIGAAGQPTNIVPTVNFDRKVILHSPAVGVFISHAPITRTPAGFQLPAGLPVEFDVPAGTRLYAITAAGTIQVSRYMTTIVATTGDVSALTKAIQDLIGWTKRLAGVR